MLASSCFRWFFWLENIEGKEADRFLSMVVAKSLMAGRANDSDSCNGSSILDSSSREDERPDGKVRARSIVMSPEGKPRLFLFLLSLETNVVVSAT